MEGYCSKGQSPQWVVVPVEEEDTISGFRREITENCDLLGCYAASSDNVPKRR
jgi:hypothetical protein